MSEQEFSIEIAAPADRVWRALTSTEETVQWYFGNTVESEWEPGRSLLYRGSDGDIDIECTILAIEAPVYFRSTFRPVWSDEVAESPASTVEWRLARDGSRTGVTVTNTDVPEGSEAAAQTAAGWPHLLAALKDYCERD